MKKFVILFLLWSVFPSWLFASIHETLPSWHWAYGYIVELRLRGGFEDLYILNRPYTRGEVAEALVKIQDRILEGAFSPTSFYMGLFDRLNSEFQEEMKEIRSKSQKAMEKKGGILVPSTVSGFRSPVSGLQSPGDYVKMGGRLQADLDKPVDVKAKYRGVYRSKVSVPVGRYLTVYNGINFDQYLVDDSLYVGKKWRGIVGYTEQAYASVGFNRFRFKFGRDFLRWGAGESGAFLFSDIARPMDQVTASARLGPFRYTFLASVLDEIELEPELADSLGGSSARRTISAHRLDASFFRGRLQCAITEMVLYGGVHRQLNWVYLNPFIFYHGAQLNESGSANTLGTVDVMLYPVKRWEVYGSLLLDDVQIEKTGSGDLEPSEIGWLVGSRWADPVGVSGLTLSGEYVRVANRTYKTPNPWETFIHRNVPLGHPLGNDFDHWQVSASQWIIGTLWFKVGYSMTRKGEGSLFTPWDEPWMDYTVEEGYSESFPTGVVEKRSQLSLSLRYYPSIHWGLEAEFHSRRYKNAYHIEGETKDEISWRVGLWVDGDVLVKLR